MPHFIGKISFELLLRGVPANAASSSHQQVERFCYDQLLPALDALFDRLAGPNEILRIDKLELDLSGIPGKGWEEIVLQQALETIEKQIQKGLQAPFHEERIELRPIQQGHFDQWLYFLQHGALPSGQAPLSDEMLRHAALETLASQSSALSRFLDLIRRFSPALPRLIAQYDPVFLDALLEASAGSVGKQLLSLRKEVEVLLKTSPKIKQKVGLEKASFPNSEKLLSIFRQVFWMKTWTTLSVSNLEPRQIVAESLQVSLGLQLIPAKVRSAFIALLKKQTAAQADRFAFMVPILAKLEKEWNVVELSAASIPKGLKPAKHDPGEMLPKTISEKGETELNKKLDDPSNKHDDSAQNLNPILKNISDAKNKILETPDLDQQVDLPQTQALPNEPEILQNQSQPKNAEIAQNRSLPQEAEIVQNQPLPMDVEIVPIQTSNDQKPKQEAAEWYLANAGLVLLHPFLSTLFQALELTTQGKFSTPEQQQQAIYLLHYAATGQSDAPEFELVFPKFLCGWEIETPLERNWNWESAQWTAEMETLLRAVIKNWGKLGSTSPDGLRASFLQRPGKLSYRPFDGWQLTLESSGIDVLLNYLPWGLSMVKLPWMKEMLQVVWNP